jgi:hypothetical protein
MRTTAVLALLLTGLTGPAFGQKNNTKTFTYSKTKQANLEMAVHFPPGWKESDKRQTDDAIRKTRRRDLRED